ENGIKEVILAVHFMAETLRNACGRSKYGMKLRYSRDSLVKSKGSRTHVPLGTGGAIKRAEKFLGGKEPFIVMNGDILTDIEYSEVIEKHISAGGAGTIALHRVENPSRYGIVRLTRGNKIAEFIEKPQGMIPSNLANAGIYVLSPRIFNYIQPGKTCSVEREVFPRLARDGMLYGHEFDGLWVDIGKPADFIEANRLLLESRITMLSSPTKDVGKGTEMKRDVAIGKGVVLGEDSTIGPNVSIGERVVVGNRVHIRNSIIFPHTRIGDHVTIDGAIVGQSVTIKKGVEIRRGCLIGDGALIQVDATLRQDTKVCPSGKVAKDTPVSKCLV
ncbi:MAG: NDP-sugar synthase, partial [Candidatus Bathyarchaeota archaeon]